jgi:mannosyltransferase OCH1-like enzyme
MIHYFQEGLEHHFMDSWEKHAGHLPMRRWTAADLPYEKFPILETYRDQKRWSILSDFVRRWAVLEFGGIYLDLDVELIKPIDRFLGYDSFLCIEGPPIFGNMAVSGGMVGNKYHADLLRMYFDVIEGRRHYPVQLEVACSPWVVTDYLKELKGGQMDWSDMNEVKTYGGLVTLPKEYFYPFNWNEEYSGGVITDNTYGIHWWKKSWA